ncbi:MAG TPA: hypothetical protein PJ982_15210, partial [Lacipirellulaceae bacterium]|nr:hypothetical protein [Lacipirellulaceae bacterium]
MRLPPRSQFTIQTFLGCLAAMSAASIARAELTLRIADYATAPMTGATGATGDPVKWTNDGYLARINFLREEPGGADRFFVNDLNGALYIL